MTIPPYDIKGFIVYGTLAQKCLTVFLHQLNFKTLTVFLHQLTSDLIIHFSAMHVKNQIIFVVDFIAIFSTI